MFQVRIQGPVAWIGSRGAASSWTRVLRLIARASRQSTSIPKGSIRKEGHGCKAEFEPGRHDFWLLPNVTLKKKGVTVPLVYIDRVVTTERVAENPINELLVSWLLASDWPK